MRNSRPVAPPHFPAHLLARVPFRWFRSGSIAAFVCVVLLSLAPAVRAAVVAHWSFDGLDDTKRAFPDSTGSHLATPADPSADFRFSGDVPFGGALKLPGNGVSFLTVRGLTGFERNSFTVAAWVYMAGAGRNYVLGDWIKPDYSFLFGIDQIPLGSGKQYITGELRSVDMDPATRNRFSVVKVSSEKAGKDVSLKQWHHVAWVWKKSDGTHGTMTLYLDGKEATSAKESHPSAVQDNPNHIATIGFKQDSRLGFNGMIDELWVFNEALPADKIDTLMRYNNLAGTGPLAKMFQKDEPAAADATPETSGNTLASAQTPATPTRPPAQAAPAPSTPTAPPTAAANVTPDNPHPPQPGAPDATARPEPALAAAPDASNDIFAAPVTPDPAPAAAPRTSDASIARTASPNPADRPVVSDNYQTPPPAQLNPPHGYSPLRMAGIITTSSIAIFLASFLMWAFNERAKMSSRRS